MTLANGYRIVVISSPKGLPLFTFTVLPTLKPARRGASYSTCTRDKVEYLMRMMQTDPEKVIKFNCKYRGK